MTIKLPTSAEQEAVEEALKNPEGAAIFFDLAVDDLEYGELIQEGDWGSGDAGSIYVDFTIADRLPIDYYDTPSSFAVLVNGVTVPQMAGLTSFPEITEDDSGSTEYLAVSARAEANRTSLNKVTEFPGIRADEVVREISRLLPYSSRYTRIDPLKQLLYFQRPDAHFWPNEFVGDVFSRVEEATPYKIRDNAWGGLTTSLVAESTEVKDYRHYSAADFGRGETGRWRPPPRVERRYSEVVVFRRNEDGADAFEPQRATIPYRRQRVPPLKNSSLWIELDGNTFDAPTRARNQAVQMAGKLARGSYKDDGRILPFFDPLIEIQDVFLVFERWEDSSGLFDRKWMCWVETYKHNKVALTTEVSYSSALVENDKIEIPDFAMAGVSGGLLKSVLDICDEVGGLIFLSEGNVWVAGEDGEILLASGSGYVFEDDGLITIECPTPTCIDLWGENDGEVFFGSAVTWESLDVDEAVIDEASSGGNAVLSGDEIVIDYVGACVPYSAPLYGENPPGEMFFNVSWVTTDGDERVIDEATSGGAAVLDVDEVAIS